MCETSPGMSSVDSSPGTPCSSTQGAFTRGAQAPPGWRMASHSREGHAVQVAFTLSAAAVVAVKATRADTDSGLPARDLLVLHPRGRLALYAGARHVCDVSVRAPAAPQAGAAQSLVRSLLPCLPTGERSAGPMSRLSCRSSLIVQATGALPCTSTAPTFCY